MVYFSLLRNLPLGHLSMENNRDRHLFINFLLRPSLSLYFSTVKLGGTNNLSLCLPLRLCIGDDKEIGVPIYVPNRDFHPARHIKLLGALPLKVTELLI